MKKKLLGLLLCACAIFSLTACGGSTGAGSATGSTGDDEATLTVAYQYGLAYAPLVIAQNEGLIEQAYEEQTGKKVKVEWVQMNSGADINNGIASGDIDVGFMGSAPAITGVSKEVGYKIFTNLSGQEHGLMVNSDDINGFEDLIGSDSQIALVNIGSIQHILLAKTLVERGYDAHELDSNLIAMKHPDGMTALETGSVAAHFTTNPYIYRERKEDNLHEIEDVASVCAKDDSFIVGVASETLYDSDKELYEALCAGISNSIDYVNNNLEETAKLTCEYDGNTVDDEIEYLKYGSYKTETQGLYELAKFMFEHNFIEQDPGEYSNLVFDNVKGN